MRYFQTVLNACADIGKGLWITLRTMVKPAITVQYPDEKLVPYPGFRGVLLYDAEICISCSLCVKACPSECIQLESRKNEAGKRVPKVSWYSLDVGKCNFCRLCEEACPTKPKAVWHSRDFEAVFSSREEMVRYWRKGTEYPGQWYDPVTRTYKPVAGQVSLQTVPERILY
ncbi:MAG: hypothetical protein A2X36_15300 [Elusimicrobia bacterium GWA2_69_24]|nr:MAG: hypothetical protein A2X36_15300 [Elusimicrobia bacterium GWA2_69_24]HBL18087.1 NADH-quinone oxidoreductase subunit I [Elusimicrobiota bacterium]